MTRPVRSLPGRWVLYGVLWVLTRTCALPSAKLNPLGLQPVRSLPCRWPSHERARGRACPCRDASPSLHAARCVVHVARCVVRVARCMLRASFKACCTVAMSQVAHRMCCSFTRSEIAASPKREPVNMPHSSMLASLAGPTVNGKPGRPHSQWEAWQAPQSSGCSSPSMQQCNNATVK